MIAKAPQAPPTSARKLGSTEGKQPSMIRSNAGLALVNMGSSGSGKTTMIESLYDTPEHAEHYAPVAVLDADHKAHVLRDSLHLEVYSAVTWDQIHAHYEALQTAKYGSPFRTIVWDGLAIMQSKSHTHVGVDAENNPQLRQNLYGKSNVEMTKIAEQATVLTELGFNVIFNVWAKPRTQDPDTSVEMVYPDLTGKLLRDFIGVIDFVVYTECAPKIMLAGKQVQGPYPPIMRTGGSTTYATRSAISPDSPLRDMPDIIYNPSLSSILDSFHGQPWPTDKHKKPSYATS